MSVSAAGSCSKEEERRADMTQANNIELYRPCSTVYFFSPLNLHLEKRKERYNLTTSLDPKNQIADITILTIITYITNTVNNKTSASITICALLPTIKDTDLYYGLL